MTYLNLTLQCLVLCSCTRHIQYMNNCSNNILCYHFAFVIINLFCYISILGYVVVFIIMYLCVRVCISPEFSLVSD